MKLRKETKQLKLRNTMRKLRFGSYMEREKIVTHIFF